MRISELRFFHLLRFPFPFPLAVTFPFRSLSLPFSLLPPSPSFPLPSSFLFLPFSLLFFSSADFHSFYFSSFTNPNPHLHQKFQTMCS
jgi:hypothetical protein